MSIKVIILSALIVVSQSLFSQAKFQDSVFLMNGHLFNARVIDTLPGVITVSTSEKADKKIQYEPDQLYMVKFRNGFKRYYYVQDTTIDNYFTRGEMWMYMKGERDARKGFKARGSLIGAGIMGLLGGMTGTFWGPLAPYGFMALSGIPKVKIKHSTVSDLSNLQSDAYILGYERVARQKRKTKSIISGTVGLLVGYGFYALFYNLYPESVNAGGL